MIDAGLIVAFLLATLLSALFSGSETGFYTFSRLRLRVEAEHGEHAARRVQRIVRRPTVLLAVLLIGNNLALELVTLAGQLFCERHVPLPPQARATLSALILTPILFVAAEAFPKNVFLAAPYERLARTSWIMLPIYRLLLPLGWLVSRFANSLARLVPRPRDEAPPPTAGGHGMEPALHLGLHEGLLTRTEHLLAAGVLRFGQLRAADVAIPLEDLPQLCWPPQAEAWQQAFAGRAETRGVIYETAEERVRGMVHALDFAMAAASQGSLESVVRPLTEVPADQSVSELLEVLHRDGHQLVVVRGGRGHPRLARLQDVAQAVLGSHP